jgi:SAM-dependent methyltransferase
MEPAGRVSAWVRRWSHLVAPGATVLDVACGAGRHVRWFAGRGHAVTAVDREAAVLEPLRDMATVVRADLESSPWPLPGTTFGAVVVTNYLWRPLWPSLLASVAEGGVLMVETFGVDQAAIGRPSNPDFLLRPGELLQAADGLRVVAYEDGFGDDATEGGEGSHPGARFVQRIVAVRERLLDGPADGPPRYRLDSGRRPVEPPVAGG